MLKLCRLSRQAGKNEDSNKLHPSIQAQPSHFVPNDNQLLQLIEEAQVIFEDDSLTTENTFFELEGNYNVVLDTDFEFLQESSIAAEKIDTGEKASGSIKLQ